MSIEDSTIALAGIFQATDLVRSVARHGMVDQAPFESSIYSILQLDANSTEAVYGSVGGVKTGLLALLNQFQKNAATNEQRKREMETMRYALGTILLERKLSKHPDMLPVLQAGIVQANELANTCSPVHPDVIAHLARLYSNTLSTFDYRIQVSGEPRYLENQHNADKVRALLLAAVRSAVLWRQKGGSRLQLIVSRGKIIRIAQRYLEHINTV